MSYFDTECMHTLWKILASSSSLNHHVCGSDDTFLPSSCCFNHCQIEGMGVHLHRQEC